MDSERESPGAAFYEYSSGIRSISSDAFDQVLEAAEGSGMFKGFSESAEGELEATFGHERRVGTRAYAIRQSSLRIKIFDHYGTSCSVSGVRHADDVDRHYEVEVAHFRPVEHDGPDEISNCAPMTRSIHWAFDLGHWSMTDAGELIFSSRLSEGHKAMLAGRRFSFHAEARTSGISPDSYFSK